MLAVFDERTARTMSASDYLRGFYGRRCVDHLAKVVDTPWLRVTVQEFGTKCWYVAEDPFGDRKSSYCLQCMATDKDDQSCELHPGCLQTRRRRINISLGVASKTFSKSWKSCVRSLSSREK